MSEVLVCKYCGLSEDDVEISLSHAPDDCRPGDINPVDCDHDPECLDCILEKIWLFNKVETERN